MSVSGAADQLGGNGGGRIFCQSHVGKTLLDALVMFSADVVDMIAGYAQEARFVHSFVLEGDAFD
jgi:hypothetical protein